MTCVGFWGMRQPAKRKEGTLGLARAPGTLRLAPMPTLDGERGGGSEDHPCGLTRTREMGRALSSLTASSPRVFSVRTVCYVHCAQCAQAPR